MATFPSFGGVAAPATWQSSDLPVELGREPALSTDRLSAAGQSVFGTLQKERDLKITAAAARALAQLFAALATEPGSGSEVPAAVRGQVLDMLIRESHQLADSLCQAIVGQDGKVPLYLRAKLLQLAAHTIADQWVASGEIDTRGLREVAKLAFGGQVASVDQDLVDIFHMAGDYKPASNQTLSDARITEAVVRAHWKCLQEVQSFDLRRYDEERASEPEFAPFSYGRDSHQVAHEITRLALAIVRENAISGVDLDLATTWTQNSLERAASLVRAEYRLLTDRALRSAFKDNLYSEAAIHHVCDLYPAILQRIETRARNGFILVERNAIDAMAASAFPHYLVKKPVPHSQPMPEAPSAVGQSAASSSPASSEPDHAQENPSSKRVKPFCFGG